MPIKRPRSRSPREADSVADPTEGERLHKVLARCGVGSRRECETLIVEGRVDVDRQVVRQLGVRVDATRQQIRVDGVPLKTPKLVYFALNKPPGVVSTNRDPDGRPRVIDLIDSDERLFSIGRLDRNSEGLILCTNDGDLAHRLTHPKFGVEKRYQVRVAGRAEWDELSALLDGVHFSDGFAKVSELRIRRRYRHHTELEIVLDEGRNREIRRLLAKVGHKVVKLKRIAIGPLRLGDLPLGAHRRLTRQEVQGLKKFASRVPNLSRGRTAKGSPRARHDKQGSERQPAQAVATKTATRRRGGGGHSAKRNRVRR